MKFLPQVGIGQRNAPLSFSDDLDHDPDLGIALRILQYCRIGALDRGLGGGLRSPSSSSLIYN